MTAPDFTVTLSPAQWEHLAEHGWTLTTAPTTECRNSLHDVRSAPVSEYHCPECGRAPYRSKDGDWYCFDPKGESTCRWRGPNPLVTPCCSPVPATVPCPECGGTGQARIGDLMTYLPPCRRCSGSGVVPRVVVVVRPEMAIRYPYLYRDPAEQVGTATVTAVPVVDGNPLADEGEPGYVERPALVRYVSRRVGLVLAYCPDGERWHDVTHLFPTPPKPGDTVWRLDRNEER